MEKESNTTDDVLRLQKYNRTGQVVFTDQTPSIVEMYLNTVVPLGQTPSPRP